MISSSDPPPLQVRVESLKPSAEAPPTFSAPIGLWVRGMLIISVMGIIGIWRENRDKGVELLTAALSNALPRQSESGVLRVLPVGSDMQRVRKYLADVRVTCRAERGTDRNTRTGAENTDSSLTCLGLPIVRANTFTRLRLQFSEERNTLAAVRACPTFVHWSTTAVPATLDDRVAHTPTNDCWRDETNPADNEWTFATLPDRAFTVAVVHGADTVSRANAPTKDTLIVLW